MSKTYPYWEDGEVTVLESGESLFFRCCDCHLIHEITVFFDPQMKRVALDMKRDNRKTAAARRRRKR